MDDFYLKDIEDRKDLKHYLKENHDPLYNWKEYLLSEDIDESMIKTYMDDHWRTLARTLEKHFRGVDIIYFDIFMDELEYSFFIKEIAVLIDMLWVRGILTIDNLECEEKNIKIQKDFRWNDLFKYSGSEIFEIMVEENSIKRLDQKELANNSENIEKENDDKTFEIPTGLKDN